MANWKVLVNIDNNKKQKTVFVKNVETMEEAYSEAKYYFINQRPEIDFWSVEKATKIKTIKPKT